MSTFFILVPLQQRLKFELMLPGVYSYVHIVMKAGKNKSTSSIRKTRFIVRNIVQTEERFSEYPEL